MPPTSNPSKDDNIQRYAVDFTGKNRGRRETSKNSREKNVTLFEVKPNRSLREKAQGLYKNMFFIPLVCASALLIIIFLITARIVYCYYSERKSRKKLESNIIHFAFK